MGRKRLIGVVRKKAFARMLLGAIMGFCPIGCMIIGVPVFPGVRAGVMLIPMILFFIGAYVGIVGLVFWIKPFKHPMFKKNPNLIDQVENMMTNKRFDNKYIVLSDRCIGNVSELIQIAYLEEVFLVVAPIIYPDDTSTFRKFIIYTATGEIKLKLFGDNKAAECQELVDIIKNVCPNASFGTTVEAYTYLERMRLAYKHNNGNIRFSGYVQDSYISPKYINKINMQNQYNQYNQGNYGMNYGNAMGYNQNGYNPNSYNQNNQNAYYQNDPNAYYQNDPNAYYQNNQNTYNSN